MVCGPLPWLGAFAWNAESGGPCLARAASAAAGRVSRPQRPGLAWRGCRWWQNEPAVAAYPVVPYLAGLARRADLADAAHSRQRGRLLRGRVPFRPDARAAGSLAARG